MFICSQVFGGLWRRNATSCSHMSSSKSLRMDRSYSNRRLSDGSKAGRRADL